MINTSSVLSPPKRNIAHVFQKKKAQGYHFSPQASDPRKSLLSSIAQIGSLAVPKCQKNGNEKI
jgi:hypothetical protein